MNWQALHILVDSNSVEILSDTLFKMGALSINIEDAKAGTEAEIPLFIEADTPPIMWQENILIALFDTTVDVDIVMHAASNALGLFIPHYWTTAIADTDWVKATQSQFHPILISDRLRITPSWHPVPTDPQIINITLDPGLAFGTGNHPTTQLCLKWLDNFPLAAKSLLDYGCGSGILAITASKLGANGVDGVDIDSQAIHASQRNAQQNNVACAFYLPDRAPERQYDVIIANILANPLKTLAPLFAKQCALNGHVILSGILNNQVSDIISTYAQWFSLAVFDEMEGWSLLTGTRIIE